MSESSVEKDFEKAAVDVKELPKQSNEVLLKLYALYKQATHGDVEGKRPGLFDLRGRAKFDAWASKHGMTQEEAKKAYVEYVKSLLLDASS